VLALLYVFVWTDCQVEKQAQALFMWKTLYNRKLGVRIRLRLNALSHFIVRSSTVIRHASFCCMYLLDWLPNCQLAFLLYVVCLTDCQVEKQVKLALFMWKTLTTVVFNCTRLKHCHYFIVRFAARYSSVPVSVVCIRLMTHTKKQVAITMAFLCGSLQQQIWSSNSHATQALSHCLR
jgi:hypothetical protein